MKHTGFDIVIPLYRVRWNTRAVIEGLTAHYRPRHLHIVTPTPEAAALRSLSADWETGALCVHEEETFFPNQLTKETICAELNLGESLYTPGWFYQQLLKLGAYEGITDLSEWYLVWDSDLLPVAAWPVIQANQPTFALLQHSGWGNPSIVSKWDKWIRSVLGVTPLTDPVGTFVPHHMWFKQQHLRSFAQQVGQYFQSSAPWPRLMMRSANTFGTFSEYWSYASWVAQQAPSDLAFHPYSAYGETTERFFDDGTGLFSAAFRRYQDEAADGQNFSPSYAELTEFIEQEYGREALPSSLSFESSPRHLKKNKETVHIEEQRSRWNPRTDAS